MTRRHTYGTNGRTAAKGRPKRKDESGQEMERLYFKGGRPRGNLGSRAEQEGKTDREREREGGEGRRERAEWTGAADSSYISDGRGSRPFRGMTHDVSRDPPGNYGPPERCPDGAPVDPRLRESAGRGLARRPRGVDRELVERGGLAPGALPIHLRRALLPGLPAR